jgi:16S rRNA (guanine527-N7)-methyltransferase
MNQYKEALSKLSKTVVTDKQMQDFAIFYEAVITYNEHTNLTTITKEEDFMIKHIIDSVSILGFVNLKKPLKIADIGTGAGFPGIPLKIMLPEIELTLIESNGKKISFLNEVVSKLKIEANIVHERAEEYAKNNQKKFDVVVSRAVAELRELIEISVPMLKEKGIFYAYKSNNYQNELIDSNHTLKVLHTNKRDVFEFILPNNKGQRAIIKFVKNKHISGYPRSYQQIKKKGL